MASELVGLQELNIKLSKLEARLGEKTLRRALRSTAKPVLNQMKAAAPVGSKPHKTYKHGLWVSPGHLKRSIKIGTQFNRKNKTMSVFFGVKNTAFYGINFLDLGPHYVSSRRVKRGQRSNIFKIVGRIRESRRAKSIKPYTIEQRPWFSSIFYANKNRMLNDFRQSLKVEIERAVRAN